MRRKATRRFAGSLFTALAVLGCRSAHTQLQRSPQTVEINRVRADDLARADGMTLDDALRQVRPDMLRPIAVERYAVTEMVRPSVYVDDRFVGGDDALRVIPIEDVVEVRLVRAFAARSLFGSSCPCAGGVLAVTTRARRVK